MSKLITEEVRQQVGKLAVEQINKRFDAGIDVNDAPAKPYSPRGPVYLELPASAGIPSAEQGPLSVTMSAYTARAMFRKLKPGTASPRMRRSQRFDNYAAMKQFLGHPTFRNLLLTGALRRSIKVTRSTQANVTIGLADPSQETKMRENEKFAPMWGFSGKDEASVRKFWEVTMAKRFQEMLKRQIGSRWK